MAGAILQNPLGWPALSGNNQAATNESLIEMMYDMYSYATNPDDLIRAIFEVYPDLNTDDIDTRTLAATQFATDYRYSAGSQWEANARSRC